MQMYGVHLKDKSMSEKLRPKNFFLDKIILKKFLHPHGFCIPGPVTTDQHTFKSGLINQFTKIITQEKKLKTLVSEDK